MIDIGEHPEHSNPFLLIALIGGVIVGVVLGVALGLDVGRPTVSEWFQAAGAVATVAALVAGIAAILYARDQVAEGRKQGRADRERALEDRAIEVNQRISTQEFAGYMQTAVKIGATPPGEQDARWTRFISDDEARQRGEVSVVWNTFEEIGLRYNLGLVDRALIHRFLGFASLSVYARTHWMIDKQRTRRPGWRGYVEWERLNAELLAERERRGEPVPAMPEGSISAAILPKESEGT